MTAPTGAEQLKLGDALRDIGMARADAAVDPEWRERVDLAIFRLAHTGEEFTAEDVRALAGDPPGHANAMGAAFGRARSRGLIRDVRSPKNASRASAHSRMLRVWVGTEKAKRVEA